MTRALIEVEAELIFFASATELTAWFTGSLDSSRRALIIQATGRPFFLPAIQLYPSDVHRRQRVGRLARINQRWPITWN